MQTTEQKRTQPYKLDSIVLNLRSKLLPFNCNVSVGKIVTDLYVIDLKGITSVPFDSVMEIINLVTKYSEFRTYEYLPFDTFRIAFDFRNPILNK